MIIPIRCFNCGQILASKYAAYKNLLNSPELVMKNKDGNVFFVSTDRLSSSGETWDKSKVITLVNRNEKIKELLKIIQEYHDKRDNLDQTVEGGAEKTIDVDISLPSIGANNIEALLLTQVGIKRYCCKSNLIGHIDVLDKL